MTDEEKSDLLWNATNIPYAGSEGLFELVRNLLEKEFQYGYNNGWGRVYSDFAL